MAEKEYIEREAALQAIDCDNLHGGIVSALKENIEEIPAADVRGVVLCRDCKWTKTDGMEDPAIYCEKWDRWEMPPDGFCWLGRKKEEN